MDSNVERVRALFARFNETGEVDVGALDPEVELHSRPDLPDARVWRGVGGVRGFFAELAEAFDPIRYEPRELIAAGRHVVVRAQVVGFGATSGTPIEVEEVQLWTFREGRLVRLQGFPTLDEAYATARTLDEQEAAEGRSS